MILAVWPYVVHILQYKGVKYVSHFGTFAQFGPCSQVLLHMKNISCQYEQKWFLWSEDLNAVRGVEKMK